MVVLASWAFSVCNPRKLVLKAIDITKSEERDDKFIVGVRNMESKETDASIMI